MFGRHFPWFLLLSVVVFAGEALLTLSSIDRAYDRATGLIADASKVDFWTALEEEGSFGPLLGVLLSLVVQSAATFATFQALRGEPPAYGRSVSVGLARFWPVLGTSIIMSVVFVVVGGVVGAVGIALGLRDPKLVMVTAVLAIAPLAAMWFVAVQAVVVESVGPVRGLSRSQALTGGARGRIVAIILLLATLTVVPSLLAPYLVPAPGSRGEASAAVLVPLGLEAIGHTLTAVVAAVVYHDLRRAKEGLGVDDLLKVFA